MARRGELRFVPTPTFGDWKGSGSRNLEGSNANLGVSLTDFVERMASPTEDAWRGSTDKVTYRLPPGRWPTPAARDYRSGKASEATHERNSRPLNEVVERTGGGKLNPTWVEWLMGIPLRWTELTGSAPSATEWSHWLWLQRGMFSLLACSLATTR